MAGLFNRIFRSGKRRELDFPDQRSSFKQNETFAEGSGGLKSSMRRKVRVYEDDPLINPTGPYHYDIKPQRFKGTRSVPGGEKYSPIESPSSSNDGAFDKSFRSEIQHHRRRSKYAQSSPGHYHHESRRRRHRYQDSDSENMPYNEYENELNMQMKQIQKYKLAIGNAIMDKRRLEREREKLQLKMDEMRQQHKHEVQTLNKQLSDMKQRLSALETEVMTFRNFQTFGSAPFYYSPQRMYNFQTPPNPRFQLNNTNTGNTTLAGSHSGFCPAPTGNGSGESLAHMSVATTASQSRLPLGNYILFEQDEVKVFRKNDDDIERPPTNLVSSFEITNSDNLRTSTSANSSPETKSAEKTPVASQKNEDPNLVRFEQLIAKNRSSKQKATTATVKKSTSASNIKSL